MTPAPPPAEPASPPSPAPLSYAVFRVTFACPNCGKPRVFTSEPARTGDPDTRPARCGCGAYLGEIVIGPGRMRLLRLAGPV